MPLILHEVDKLLRLFFVSFLLWYPFCPYMVSCAVLPVSYALSNSTNPIVSTVQYPHRFYCSYETSWTDTLAFDYRECLVAGMYMLYVETSGPAHSSALREFYNGRAQPSGHFARPLATPRKYVTRESSNLCKCNFSFLSFGCRVLAC